jgi:uncharacterized protein (TIGR00725 family)
MTSQDSDSSSCEIPAQPAKARDQYTGHQIRIGVMGSAGGELSTESFVLCRRLGGEIARCGCCLLTGACPGLPHEAVLGAKANGGHVVGVSPGMNLREHVELFRSPYKEYDVLIFTGLGLMGRELINIYSSDLVVIVGGRSGTLGEYSIAYEAGKLIGVLTGTGGVAEALQALEASLSKATGAQVIYHSEPESLIAELLERFSSGAYVCPCLPDKIIRMRERRDAQCECSPTMRRPST